MAKKDRAAGAMDPVLRLGTEDNVALATRTLRAGHTIETRTLSVSPRQDIPSGHKIALHRIAAGDPIRKYGQTIGFARSEIQPGDHVHTHNVEVREFGRDYQFCVDARPVEFRGPEEIRTFLGYDGTGTPAASL